MCSYAEGYFAAGGREVLEDALLIVARNLRVKRVDAEVLRVPEHRRGLEAAREHIDVVPAGQEHEHGAFLERVDVAEQLLDQLERNLVLVQHRHRLPDRRLVSGPDHFVTVLIIASTNQIQTLY